MKRKSFKTCGTIVLFGITLLLIGHLSVVLLDTNKFLNTAFEKPFLQNLIEFFSDIYFLYNYFIVILFSIGIGIIIEKLLAKWEKWRFLICCFSFFILWCCFVISDILAEFFVEYSWNRIEEWTVYNIYIFYLIFGAVFSIPFGLLIN